MHSRDIIVGTTLGATFTWMKCMYFIYLCFAVAGKEEMRKNKGNKYHNPRLEYIKYICICGQQYEYIPGYLVCLTVFFFFLT